MNLEEYKQKYTTTDAPGWVAINEAMEKLYPGQEPKHWASAVPYMVGGEDPIDGISFYEAEYKGEKYHHFVTYGFSNLYYDEEGVGNDFSNYGFELTFRLKPFKLDNENPSWVYRLLQNIAKYVFETGKWFEPFHYIPTNVPIRPDTDIKITGIAFFLDPELGEIATPHGKVQFLQMFGINDVEINELKSNQIDAKQIMEQHQDQNPLLITDLERGL